ncbi:MAG: hypothetical protein A2X49_06210 [Lentisphaerae bacterium GWF2_52_8]|nr:MAG: hypothetical protein A2X49_06210 [Lentisphaerae bacterium GWF2_52_8]
MFGKKIGIWFVCVGALSLLLAGCISAQKTGDAIEVRYIRCIDGDTFICEIPGAYPPGLMHEVRVRIRGINAPELHDKDPELRRQAEESRVSLSEALSKANKIVLKNIEKDKYFRILADVYLDDVLISP